MRYNGIIRKFDNLGRITIPKEFRKILELDENAKAEIILVDNGVLIRNANKTCSLCGKCEFVMDIENSFLCNNCIKKIKML